MRRTWAARAVVVLLCLALLAPGAASADNNEGEPGVSPPPSSENPVGCQQCRKVDYYDPISGQYIVLYYYCALASATTTAPKYTVCEEHATGCRFSGSLCFFA